MILPERTPHDHVYRCGRCGAAAISAEPVHASWCPHLQPVRIIDIAQVAS